MLSKEIPSRIRRPLSPFDPDVLKLRRVLPGTLEKSTAFVCDHLAERCDALGLDDLARQARRAADLKRAVDDHKYWSLGGGGPNPLDPNQTGRAA
jgi:hypothetical protein